MPREIAAAGVADDGCDHVDWKVCRLQQVRAEVRAEAKADVLHEVDRRLLEQLGEVCGEGGAAHAGDGGEAFNRVAVRGPLEHAGHGACQPPVAEKPEKGRARVECGSLHQIRANNG